MGPFEHHSNLLPWRELGAEVRTVLMVWYFLSNSDKSLLSYCLEQIVWIEEDGNGGLDEHDLENKLKVSHKCW